MDRESLERANRELMAKRARLGIGQSGKIATPALSVQKTAEQQYILSLRAGEEPPQPEFKTINGRDPFQPERYTPSNPFDGFDSDRHPDLVKAVRTVKQWFNGPRTKGGAIILAGWCGCGKTHIAQAIHKYVGYRSVYWNEIELFKAIRSSYGERGGRSEEAIMAAIWRADLLVYDDLGAYESNNDSWMTRIYYDLFNGRKEAGKATMVTTNLPDRARDADNNVVEPLRECLGERVYSRLKGQMGDRCYYVDLFSVPDYRLRGM